MKKAIKQLKNDNVPGEAPINVEVLKCCEDNRRVVYLWISFWYGEMKYVQRIGDWNGNSDVCTLKNLRSNFNKLISENVKSLIREKQAGFRPRRSSN